MLASSHACEVYKIAMDANASLCCMTVNNGSDDVCDGDSLRVPELLHTSLASVQATAMRQLR